MIPPDNTSYDKESSSWQFQFARNTSDQLIPIPTGDDLEGYLVRDTEETTFAQVRFLKTEDTDKIRACKTVWKNFENFQSRGNCYIYPEMLALGLSEETPYYVSKLPIGEPVESYLERTGPILPETAARLVLEFVESMIDHKLRFYKRYAISPKSVWLEKTSAQPRLVLGEFSPILHDKAEEANTGICLSLLRYLSSDQTRNRNFQNLCKEIEDGPQKLHVLANVLKIYTSTYLPSNFWTDYNQPIPVLQQQSSLVVETESSPGLIRSLRQTAISVAACWPIFVGGAALLLILQTVKLTVFPGEDGTTGFQNFKEMISEVSGIQAPAPEGSTSPSTAGSSSSAVASSSKGSGSRSAPSRKPVTRPLVQVAKIARKLPTRPASQGYSSPRVSQNGGVDPEKYRPRPFKVQVVTISGLDGRSDLSLQTREVIKYLKNRMGSEPALSGPSGGNPVIFEAPPAIHQNYPAPVIKPTPEEFRIEKAWQVAQLVEWAEAARNNQQLLLAIRNEVDLLKIIPQSSDAKLRLYNDLLQLAGSTELINSAEHIETLEEASYFHPMAIDILMNTFRGVASRTM